MEPLGHHIRIRPRDNRVLVHTAEQRRLVARVVLHQGREDGLLAFSLPDTHLHIEARCDRRAANRLGQRVASSLKQRLCLPVPLESYRPEPIRDQAHLHNTFRYALTQHAHHGLDLTTVMEATNLPDLLGMRLLGAYSRVHVGRWLPRIRVDTILGWLGLRDLAPADGPVDTIAAATLAATALPNLMGNTPAALSARRAMLEVLGCRLSSVETAQWLGISRRSLFRLKQRPPDVALVQAIRLQLGLRQLWQERAAECHNGAPL